MGQAKNKLRMNGLFRTVPCRHTFTEAYSWAAYCTFCHPTCLESLPDFCVWKNF